MKITLCGSLIAYNRFPELRKKLEKGGCTVLQPDSNEAEKTGQLLVNLFPKIEESDAILVCNYEKNGVPGYIGGNALIEMAYAYYHGKKIFLLNPIPDVSYRDEIVAMGPIIVGEDIAQLADQERMLNTKQ